MRFSNLFLLLLLILSSHRPDASARSHISSTIRPCSNPRADASPDKRSRSLYLIANS